jgi:hypothetical protein
VGKSGQSLSHPGRLTPVAIRDYQGDRPIVQIEKTPAEDRDVSSGVENEGPLSGNIEITAIEWPVPVAVDAQFTVGKRGEGKRAGCRRLVLFATVHDEDEAGCKVVAGNRRADAELNMHAAALAPFASF